MDKSKCKSIVFCVWKKGDYGSMGFSDYEYNIDCQENNISIDNVMKNMKYCPYCGKLIKFE